MPDSTVQCSQHSGPQQLSQPASPPLATHHCAVALSAGHGLESASAGGNNRQSAKISASIGSVQVQSVAHSALDEPEVEYPFEMLDHLPAEAPMEPPSSEEVQQAAPPVDAMPQTVLQEEVRHSWWQRLGEVIDPSALVVGGATVHTSHTIAHFGNVAHRLVCCLHCGGITHGAHSPLLAVRCRQHASATRQRQLNRMRLQGKWPSGELEQQFGSGTLSRGIRFLAAPSGGVLIADAERGSATAGGCRDP